MSSFFASEIFKYFSSGAPLRSKAAEQSTISVSKSGNLSIREILVLTSAYVRPHVQALGEGEG